MIGEVGEAEAMRKGVGFEVISGKDEGEDWWDVWEQIKETTTGVAKNALDVCWLILRNEI